MEVVNYEERYPTAVTAQNTPQSHRPTENYEERYPTVVDAQNTPHHFQQPLSEEHAPKYTASYPVDNKKPLTPSKDAYPEVVTSIDPYSQTKDPAYPNAIPPKEEVYHEPVGGAAVGGKRYCGMSKRAFLLALGILILIIVGGVGGAVGGVMAGKSKKNSTNVSGSGSGSAGVNGTSSSVAGSTATQISPADATSGVTTGTATATTTPTGSANPTAVATLDTTKSIGSLAVSMFENTDAKVSVHLYYQQGSNIAYRVYTGSGYFKTPQVLPLTTAPKSGTSLAAVETSSDSKTYVSLFYLDTYNNIICANLTSALGSAALTLTKTVIIAANTTVHSSSQIAAIYLGPSFGYRVYHQTPKGVLQELVGTTTKWQAGAVLDATAIAGSPISVSMVTTPKMNIFYVDSTAKTLFNIYYSGGWSTASALSSAALTAWNGTSTALAAIAQTNTAYLRTYYIGSDKGIYEMLDPGAGTTWNKNSGQSSKWPAADYNTPGSLVGIGWEDQVRVYYVSGGDIEQLDLGGTTWTVTNNIGG